MFICEVCCHGIRGLGVGGVMCVYDQSDVIFYTVALCEFLWLQMMYCMPVSKNSLWRGCSRWE